MSKTAPSNEGAIDAASFYAEVKRLHLRPLWLQGGRAPHKLAVPYLWKWPELRERMLRAAEIVSAQDVERRVLGLINPGLEESGRFATTPNLVAAIQLIMPGETAVAHHHTPAALRIIIEGEGAYTCTDGERCWMEPGDLILTPAWSYHDHKNEGTGPMIWLDGLDVPLIDAMDTFFFELYPGKRSQPIDKPDEISLKRFPAPGLRQAGLRWRKAYSPLTKYSWRNTIRALNEMSSSDASPYDDLRLEYFNPHTGGPVMPTIGCYAQKLRAGTRTKKHRHSSAAIYHAFRGAGQTIVEGQRFDWTAGDILAIPGWHWHEHVNASRTEDAILLSYTDEPLLESLGIHREEGDK
ncbi:MAG TPA: cupin domain-containing protein [Candidatus Acidoferrales bacterium]|nr:cupin domain-containing protein [Candidatus Acidoferrales bacterium]